MVMHDLLGAISELNARLAALDDLWMLSESGSCERGNTLWIFPESSNDGIQSGTIDLRVDVLISMVIASV